MDNEKVSIRALIEIPAGDGITLREFALADAPTIFALIDKERERLTQPGVEAGIKYKTLEDVEQSIKSPNNPNRIRFGIWNNETQYVGTINITTEKDNPKKAEIGYYLSKDFEGKGYMQKAIKALTSWVFANRGIEEIYASVHQGNEKSKGSENVLRRAGFNETETKGEEKIFTLSKSA